MLKSKSEAEYEVSYTLDDPENLVLFDCLFKDLDFGENN